MPLVPYSPSVAKSNCTLTCEKTGPTFNLIYYLHKWFPHDFMVSVTSFKSYSLQQDVYIYSKIDTGYAVGCSSLLLTSPYHSVSSTSQSDPFRRWCRPQCQNGSPQTSDSTVELYWIPLLMKILRLQGPCKSKCYIVSNWTQMSETVSFSHPSGFSCSEGNGQSTNQQVMSSWFYTFLQVSKRNWVFCQDQIQNQL